LINPDRFPQAIREALDKTFARSMETVGEYLSYGLSGLFELLSYLPWLILIPILAFFLLKDAEAFRRSALRALPRGRLRGRGAELFQDINNTLAAYIRAALTGCLLVGVICTIGFMVIGVPYALLLGVLAGLLEFIPLVGPLVVAMGAASVASFHSIGQAVIVLLFLGILRVLQDYVIYPRLIEHGVHMHPLAVILAILCGAELAGVAGIFLAIPAVAIMSVTYRHWLKYRGSPGLMADLLKPAPTTPSAPSDQPASAAQPSSTAAPRPEVASRRPAPTR
jgi:predicted PurR-regulated permease PerM